MDAYTLKQRQETEELHLFKGEMTPPSACNSLNQSICKKMVKSESEGNIFTCYNEKQARLKCAEIGRNVCGTCVAHLYSTID